MMGKSLIKISICMLLMTFMASCGIFQKKSHRGKETLESFDVFYDRFHEDADFQKSRLKFPLKGRSVDSDKVTEWTPENWLLMKSKVTLLDRDKYDVIIDQGDDYFFQRFQLKGVEFYAEYRFERLEGQWFLVYALDVNL